MSKTNALLECLLVDAKAKPTHAVIWLHGLGADGYDFLPIVQSLNLSHGDTVRFIFPHAPIREVAINKGYPMRAWHDIASFNFRESPDIVGMEASVRAVHALIQNEIERGIKASHILLAGFSQGAAVALVSSLSYPEALWGAIALSGYLPPLKPLHLLASEANRTLPIFIGHGIKDDIVPIAYGEATRDFLSEGAHTLTYKTYPIAHTVSDEEVVDIREWIESTFP